VNINCRPHSLNNLFSNKQKQMPPKKKVEGDAGKGEKLFKTLCASCHSFAAHGTGPNLTGIVGANVATKEGFSYS
jgi:cytochrome c